MLTSIALSLIAGLQQSNPYTLLSMKLPYFSLFSLDFVESHPRIFLFFY